jgi:hypothetical protein
MTVEDLRNDPSRRPNALALHWSEHIGGLGHPVATGASKHYMAGGPEDEAGKVAVSPVNGGRYAFTAEHYQPFNRGSSRDPWTDKRGDFVVKSKHRAMIAGEALLRRLQTGSMD